MSNLENSELISAERLEFDLSDRLRKALRVAGLTAGDLAARIGVARSTVNNWINGHTTPKRRDLSAISDILRVSPAWLNFGDLSDHKRN